MEGYDEGFLLLTALCVSRHYDNFTSWVIQPNDPLTYCPKFGEDKSMEFTIGLYHFKAALYISGGWQILKGNTFWHVRNQFYSL